MFDKDLSKIDIQQVEDEKKAATLNVNVTKINTFGNLNKLGATTGDMFSDNRGLSSRELRGEGTLGRMETRRVNEGKTSLVSNGQVTEAAGVPVLWFCWLLNLNTVALTTRKFADALSIGII